MIARLRLRHARMWDVLLVVVPAVLVAALSVRRGEAARQELPRALHDEVSSQVQAFRVAEPAGEWLGWLRDEVSQRWVLEVDAVDGLGDAVLLYWTAKPADDLVQYIEFQSIPESVDFAKWSLPDDAVLLGAAPRGDNGRYPAPAPLVAGGGVLLWYDLANAAMVWARTGPEPAR